MFYFSIDEEGRLIIPREVPSKPEETNKLYDKFNSNKIHVYANEYCLWITTETFEQQKKNPVKSEELQTVILNNPNFIVINLGLNITNEFLRNEENKISWASSEYGLHFIFNPVHSKTRTKLPKTSQKRV